jgi:hypothetical protein
MARRPYASAVSRLLIAALVFTAVGALVRGQSKQFYAQRQALRDQAKGEQQSAGLAGSANTKALFKAYPTPEIALAPPVNLQPGQAAPVTFAGKFSDKTTFMSGSDALTLANVVVAANKFTANAQVAAGASPGWVRIYAFAPVSVAETWVPLFVGAPRAYTLTAQNGWTIKLTPDAPKFALDQRASKVGYKAEYFKPGETKPFETTTGKLELESDNTSENSLQFNLSAGTQGSTMAELEQVTTRMGELMKAGKYGSKELNDLNARMEVLQERMMKEMQAQAAGPAAMQKKQDDFGCGTIFLNTKSTGDVTGNASCGKNVGSLQLTGK